MSQCHISRLQFSASSHRGSFYLTQNSQNTQNFLWQIKAYALQVRNSQKLRVAVMCEIIKLTREASVNSIRLPAGRSYDLFCVFCEFCVR